MAHHSQLCLAPKASVRALRRFNRAASPESRLGNIAVRPATALNTNHPPLRNRNSPGEASHEGCERHIDGTVLISNGKYFWQSL
ncbi:MAG: hypothetical protein Kow0074_02830 [Candidatus Zixiibacteriota bacterium]